MAQSQKMEISSSSSVDLSEVVTTEFLRKVSRKFTHWEGLASSLGLTDAKVHEIKEDYRGNASEMKYQMLLAWKQMKGREAILGALVDGLRDAEITELADDIEDGKYTESIR